MADEAPQTKTSSTGAEGFAQFARRRRGASERAIYFIHTHPAIIPLAVLTASIVVFGLVLGARFFSPFTLTLVMQQVMIVGIVAIAQTLVILTAGIDLSVGAIMVCSSVVMGQCTFRYGLPPEISIVIGLAFGTACGLVSGILVAIVRLPPFIVTLGMWQIVLAANFLYSRNETIRSQDIAEQAPILQYFGRDIQIGGAVFTYGVIAMLILAAIVHYLLTRTAWGRHVYAVGDDPRAAELAGVRARHILLTVYAGSGLICGFAGWALIGRLGSVSPTAGQLTNIETITAVVIGGTSLFGGRGSVIGSLFGALIVGVFSMGLRMAGADPQWTYLLIGVLIIVAVGFDHLVRRAAA